MLLNLEQRAQKVDVDSRRNAHRGALRGLGHSTLAILPRPWGYRRQRGNASTPVGGGVPRKPTTGEIIERYGDAPDFTLLLTSVAHRVNWVRE